MQEPVLNILLYVYCIHPYFYNQVQELYTKNPSIEEIKELLGRARAKKGMFEGDLENGELEIGQILRRN